MTGYEKSQDSADEDEGGQHEDAESVVSDIGLSGSINALSLSLYFLPLPRCPVIL